MTKKKTKRKTKHPRDILCDLADEIVTKAYGMEELAERLIDTAFDLYPETIDALDE